MNENEMMNINNEEIENDVVVEEDSGIGTGLAMLIGSGLTLAGIAGVKAFKKVWKKHKAKKILETEVVDLDEEDIEAIDELE